MIVNVFLFVSETIDDLLAVVLTVVVEVIVVIVIVVEVIVVIVIIVWGFGFVSWCVCGFF